jgi:hypothetical protein
MGFPSCSVTGLPLGRYLLWYSFCVQPVSKPLY